VPVGCVVTEAQLLKKKSMRSGDDG
jgi:hypothetical protein